jgi:two-component system, cell cycle sensor histidine kinase and response regulator CckA
MTEGDRAGRPNRQVASEGRHATLAVPNQAFQAILDAVPGAWFFTRRDGTFAYVNGGACEGLGYTRDELLGLTLFDVDPTLTEELLAMLWATTAPGESRTIRVRHRRKDGVAFPVEVRTTRIFLDAEDLAVSYTVDLTAAEQTELINRRLLAAIEQARDAVVMTDALGKVEYVNPAYERVTGLSSVEVRDRPWTELEIRDDREVAAGLTQVLTSGAPWSGRVCSLRRDGEPNEEEVTLSSIRDDQQQLVGCVAVKRDITERLRIERQLLRTQKVEAVGQLAGGIAHDFSNLLQVIQGHTHVIERRSESGALEPMLNEINEAVRRGSALVRQLLAFSRTGTIERGAVRLDALVSGLLELVRSLIGEHIELEWRCDTGPLFVHGNAAQLEQVIVNLCINARDAMPNGGRLSLSLDLAPGGAEAPGAGEPSSSGRAALTVRDYGEGMSEEVQRRLFEPFFTTKPFGHGSGLGLATVDTVVRGHGGSIEVESALGRGTTFRVLLPLADAAAGRAAAASQAAAARERVSVEGHGRVALVVEDERAVRELTVDYMHRAGFRVIAAADGVEAEALLRAGGNVAPDVAVLDAVMPRRGGEALFQWMREHGLACPVVFVTGYDFESLASAVHRDRAAILHKPFSESELLSQVAAVLDERAHGAL